jgi:hypothetical protein
VACACGLAAEARIARRAGFSVVVGAGDRERLAALLEAAAPRARYLLSFGIAGALQPDLEPGDVVLSGEVVAEGGLWRSDDALLCGLVRATGARPARIFGARKVLATAAEKARLGAETGAAAVDLESEIVARTAASVGIPFLALRAIADARDQDLPPAALIPLAVDGTPSVLRVLAEVIRRPRQIGALCALGLETRRALAALAVPARALHALLACV